ASTSVPGLGVYLWTTPSITWRLGSFRAERRSAWTAPGTRSGMACGSGAWRNSPFSSIICSQKQCRGERMRAFTEEQQRFIAHTAGPCLVNATAGSGKTTSLMAFIADLIRRGIEPERILCVTFTNAAADQMAPRLREMGVEQAGRVNFRTIHSL